MQRARRFLSSAPNIVGCFLALGGLGLFYVGLIHGFWMVLVPGLYATGVICCPKPSQARIAERSDLSPEQLTRHLHQLVHSVSSGLPPEALAELAQLQTTLSELLPRLEQLNERGVISARDSYTVVESVRRYLPDTLDAYLRLPKQYALTQTIDGKPPARILVDQLKVLNRSLREIASNAFTGDAEKLVSNGHFLRQILDKRS